MTPLEVLLTSLWRSAWGILPVALLALFTTRWLAARPATRHWVWVSVLGWMVVGGFLPAYRGPAPIAPLPAIAINDADQSRAIIDLPSIADVPVARALYPAPVAPAHLLESPETEPADVAAWQPLEPLEAPVYGPDFAALLDTPVPTGASRDAIANLELALAELSRPLPTPIEPAPDAEEAPSPLPNAEICSPSEPTAAALATSANGAQPSATVSAPPAAQRVLQSLEAIRQRWHVAVTSLRNLAESLPAPPPWVWLIGGGLFAAWVGLQSLSARTRALADRPAPKEVTRCVAAIARKLRITAPVTVMSDRAVSPHIWCAMRPRLVLPRRLWADLDRDGRHAVVCHELAHLSRCDHWVRRFELAATALFWWHPILWWVRHRIAEEADLSCDAWVTWLAPRKRRAYAEALLRAQSACDSNAEHPSLAVGLLTKRSQKLARRLTMVMTQSTRPQASMLAGVWASMLLLAGWVTLPAWACPPHEKKAEARSQNAAAPIVVSIAGGPSSGGCANGATAPVIAARANTDSDQNAAGGTYSAYFKANGVQPYSYSIAAAPTPEPGDEDADVSDDEDTEGEDVAAEVEAALAEADSSAAEALADAQAEIADAVAEIQEAAGEGGEDRIRELEAELRALEAQLRDLESSMRSRRAVRRSPTPPPAAASPAPPAAPAQPVPPTPPIAALAPLPPMPPMPAMPAMPAQNGMHSHDSPAPMAPTRIARRSRNDGAIISREYCLPQGKTEALFKLMVRDDVPVRVSRNRECISVNATEPQHAAIAAFCDIIRGEWQDKAYKLPDGKLDAFADLMSRNDVPIKVSRGGDGLNAEATPSQHEIIAAFLEVIHPGSNPGALDNIRQRRSHAPHGATPMPGFGPTSPLAMRFGAANNARDLERMARELRNAERSRGKQLQNKARQLRNMAQMRQRSAEQRREMLERRREEYNARREEMQQRREEIRERSSNLPADDAQRDALEAQINALEEQLGELESQLEGFAEQVEAEVSAIGGDGEMNEQAAGLLEHLFEKQNEHVERLNDAVRALTEAASGTASREAQAAIEAALQQLEAGAPDEVGVITDFLKSVTADANQPGPAAHAGALAHDHLAHAHGVLGSTFKALQESAAASLLGETVATGIARSWHGAAANAHEAHDLAAQRAMEDFARAQEARDLAAQRQMEEYARAQQARELAAQRQMEEHARMQQARELAAQREAEAAVKAAQNRRSPEKEETAP